MKTFKQFNEQRKYPKSLLRIRVMVDKIEELENKIKNEKDEKRRFKLIVQRDHNINRLNMISGSLSDEDIEYLKRMKVVNFSVEEV